MSKACKAVLAKGFRAAMDFDYSEDQKALKDEARRFLAAVSPLTVARGVLDDPASGHDAPLWARIVEQGWCGAAIPEEYGGLGMGHVDLCALAEELGRAVAPVPFASSVCTFAEAVMVAGSEAQKQALLPGVACGEVVGTLAVSEGPGATVPPRLAARVAAGRLSGAKIPVIDGMVATHSIVLAAGDEGPGLFLVDLSDPGVTRETVTTIDPARGGARLDFAGVPAEPLGAPGEGFALLERVQDRAAVLLAFEALGGADRCLEMARDYALERHAFGRPIGSYQAIKHKLADVFVKNEVARANAYFGAWALSSDAPDLPLAAAAARVSATNAYWLATKEMIQTFGGIGFTWEADCHLFFRRAKHLSLVLGGQAEWKRRLAGRIEAKAIAEAAEGTLP